MAKYILRNVSKNDVNLGDLRYRIPSGKARDLLSRTAHLSLAAIEKSRTSGSISKYIAGGSLVEIKNLPPVPKAPPKTENKTGTPIVFPQKVKSYITISVGDVEEGELKDSSTSEDDEMLKQLEQEAMRDEKLPTVIKGEE